MRPSDRSPHPEGLDCLSASCGVKTATRRSATGEPKSRGSRGERRPSPERSRKGRNHARAHSGIGVGIEAVSIKIAQAVIAEAEPHRRRFPNLCLRKVLAITSPAMAFTVAYSSQRQVRGRARPRRRHGLGHAGSQAPIAQQSRRIEHRYAVTSMHRPSPVTHYYIRRIWRSHSRPWQFGRTAATARSVCST